MMRMESDLHEVQEGEMHLEEDPVVMLRAGTCHPGVNILPLDLILVKVTGGLLRTIEKPGKAQPQTKEDQEAKRLLPLPEELQEHRSRHRTGRFRAAASMPEHPA